MLAILNREKGYLAMKKISLLTDTQLDNEIGRVWTHLETIKGKFQIADYTRYLRRLQKERFRRQHKWEKQETKEWDKKLKEIRDDN